MTPPPCCPAARSSPSMSAATVWVNLRVLFDSLPRQRVRRTARRRPPMRGVGAVLGPVGSARVHSVGSL
eukprot:6244632-Alexandrium_andersonii.AAC.1